MTDQHALQLQIVLNNCIERNQRYVDMSHKLAVSLWFSSLAKCKTINIAFIHQFNNFHVAKI